MSGLSQLASKFLRRFGGVANFVILGSGITLIFSILMATVVFDKVSPTSSLPSQNLQLGVNIGLNLAGATAYLDAVLHLRTTIEILRLEKIGVNGTDPEEAGMIDMVPILNPAHGRGTIQFKIASVPFEEMPHMMSVEYNNITFIPAVYIPSTRFSEFRKSALKVFILGLKWHRFLTVWAALFAFACVIMGFRIHKRDQTNK